MEYLMPPRMVSESKGTTLMVNFGELLGLGEIFWLDLGSFLVDCLFGDILRNNLLSVKRNSGWMNREYWKFHKEVVVHEVRKLLEALIWISPVVFKDAKDQNHNPFMIIFGGLMMEVTY